MMMMMMTRWECKGNILLEDALKDTRIPIKKFKFLLNRTIREDQRCVSCCVLKELFCHLSGIIYEVFCLNLDSKSCYRNPLLSFFVLFLFYFFAFWFHSLSLFFSSSHRIASHTSLLVVLGEFIKKWKKYSDWSFHTWVNLHFILPFISLIHSFLASSMLLCFR